jgi:hypothetical protein
MLRWRYLEACCIFTETGFIKYYYNMFIADLAEGLLTVCSSDNAHRGFRPMVSEPELSLPLLPRPAIAHRPKPATCTSHQHILIIQR